MTEEKMFQRPEAPASDQTTPAAITGIIQAIGAEEVALANMITQLSDEVFNVVTTIPFTLANFERVDNDVKRKLKLILKKNIVLEKKLRDAVNLAANLTIVGAERTAFINALNSVLNSIAAEEHALGNLVFVEALKLEQSTLEVEVDGVSIEFTVQDQLNLNNNVESVVRVILDKNIVLEEKLEDVLKGLSNVGVTATSPDATVTAALNNVISSIAFEEAQFATLIQAEADLLASVLSDALENEATPDQIHEFELTVENMMHTILNKNIVLETKFEDVLDFLTPPTTLN